VKGYDVVAVFIDDDRSAYSRKPRPGYIELHDLIGAVPSTWWSRGTPTDSPGTPVNSKT
jgi:hypothetical protein